MTQKDPIRPTDDDARNLARGLLRDATYGALAVLDPRTGAPSVTRVAIGTTLHGMPVSLISRLATHFSALEADQRCSLLLGEPGPKGDPLTHPRMTLHCDAGFIHTGMPAHDSLRAHYLATHPKSKLYIDFPDFSFVRFTVNGGLLNGGFGKAFQITSDDLRDALG
ncbi:pyridoxamine 5-phosphate oxidase [Shimia sp. Alg240-R146]|uniref:pyridoxamine 5-phosphate oxidase n=1 Tax=Shimia sp. Alg240-R146 TaxID=2993449 RepID=UPI0022E0CE00|nr:pyridoxamine 5-phosphate oxidase [Shimia sp. Alg240-R146]